MFSSAHALRIMLVSTASAVCLALAADLMSAASSTAAIAHHVLGAAA